jgi:hypothetical protein
MKVDQAAEQGLSMVTSSPVFAEGCGCDSAETSLGSFRTHLIAALVDEHLELSFAATSAPQL